MTKNGTQKPFKRWLRVTSFLTLTAFISTSFGMPVSAAASEINVPVKAKAPLSSLTIPENLGTLEEMFLGGDGRFVVLLQDAHAIPDAQKNAAEIIAHLQKNYSVNQVAVEGASDFFDTRFLKSFPDKEKLQKVMDEYMSRGELTGAGLAAVFDSGGAVFQGIEDWDLYEKADGLFLKALGLQETALKTLQENKSELKIQKRKIYSSQLFETDELLSNYENGSEDFLGVLEKFFAVQVPAEGTELRVLYDHLSRAGRDGENLAKEVRKQAADIQKQLNARKNPAKSEDLLLFNKELQNFQVSALSPREFAGWLINFASEKGVPVEFPENWKALARDEARLKNLEGSKVFEEFELYTAEVKEKLFRSQDERNLDSASRRLRSAEKLVKLELSPKDWGELKNDKKLQSEFPVNFDFYKNAEERDEVFFKKLKSMTASKEAAVFMAGGFHTQGLKELLQKENISFVVVRPQIKSIPDKEIYLNQMRGEVSWKKYFEPQNGKVNLFRAFMRGTRDELVKGGSGFLLKDWRDQIIRDLSAEKKIENASFYTSLLDETVSSEKEKQPLWIEKINRVISGLKTLDREKKFDQGSILKLLAPSTVLQLAGGNAGFVSASDASEYLLGFARSELRSSEDFKKDERVVHSVFGAGKVLNASDGRIEILFDSSPREGQVFFLEAVRKDLSREVKGGGILFGKAEEDSKFSEIEKILNDQENYSLSDIKFFFIDLLQILISLKKNGKDYAPLLNRMSELLVRVNLDFPSDFSLGMLIDSRQTTAGVMSHEFLGGIFREEAESEVLKILKKRKSKGALSPQIRKLKKGLGIYRSSFSGLDEIREIQKTAPEHEFSITAFSDAGIVLAQDMRHSAAPRFLEISVNFLHTHGNEWPLEPSPQDTQSAINFSQGSYILTFNPDGDEAELAVFDRKARLWRHMVDPQKIADELYKAGFLQKPAARSELRAEEGIPDFKSDEFKTAIINPKTGERIGIELRRTNPFYPYFNLYLSIADQPGGELVSRGHIDFRIYEDKLIIGDVFPFGRAAENLEGRGLAKAIFNWLVYAAKATGRTQIANSGTPSASLAAIYEKLFGDQVSIGRGRMVPVAEIKKKFYDQDVAGKILVFYQGKKESFSLKYEETTGDYRVTATSAEQVPIGQRLRVDEDGKVRLPDGKIEGQVTGFINLMEFEGTPKPEAPLFAPKRSELRTVPPLFAPGYKFTEDLAGVQKVMIETIDWLTTQGVPGQEVLLAYRDAIAAGAELPAEFAAQGITMRKSPHPVKKGEYLVSLNVSSLSTLIKGILYLHQQDPKGALSYFLENFASKIFREANGFKLQSYIEPENEELIKGVNEVLFARRVAETDKVMSIPANPSLLGFLTKYKDEVLKIESLAVAPEFFEGVSQYEFLRWAEGTGLYSPALTEGALKVRSTNFLLNERSRVRQLYQTGGDPAKILSWDLGVITLAVLRMTFARQKVTDGGLRSALYYYLLATGQGTVDANEVQSRINLPPGQFPSDVFLRAADELLPEVQKTVEVWQGRMRSELRAGLDLPDQSARVYAPPAMTPVNAGAVEVINERLSREVARIGLDNILDIVPEWADELAAADPRINADQVISVTQGIIMAYLYEMLPASALDASAPSFFKSAAAVFRSPGEILKTQMLAWWARAFASHLVQLKDEDYRSNYAAAGQSILFEFAEAIDPEVAGLFQSLVDYGHIWSEEHPASLPESPEEAAEFGEGLGTDSLINSFLLPAGTLLLLQPDNSKTNTDFNPILLQSFPLGNFSRLRMGANSGWGIIGTETSGASAARLGAHSAAYQTAFVNISRLRERALTSTILLRPEWFSGVNAAALRKTLKENYSSELAVKLKDPKLEPETMRGMDAAVEQLLLKAYSAALTSPDRDQAINAILQGFLNSVFNHESYHLVSNWLDLRKKFGDEEFLAMMIELRASGRPQPQMVFHTIFEMVTALTLPGNEDKSELLSIYARALDVIFPAGKSLTEGKDFRERARLMVSKINGSGGIAALTPNIITQRVTDYFLKSLGQDPVAGTAVMDITYPFKDLLARAQSKAPFSVRPANLPPAFAARSEARKLSAEAEDAVSNLNKAIASERMTEASAGIEAFEKRMNELKPKLTPAEITAILARLDTSIYFLAQTSGSYSEDVRWSGFEASPVYKETKTRIESILEKYKADFSNKIANAALTVDAVAEGPEGARIIDAAQIYGRLSDDERDALVARIVELFKEHYPRVPPYLAKINIQGQIDLVRANPGGKRFLFYTSQTGQINGYLQYDINSEKKTAYLAYVGVAASEQKKGAGSFLMDTFFSEIKKLNIDKSLWISSGQSPAFYEKYLNAKKSELGADFQRLNDYTVDDLEGFITKMESSPADLGPLFKVNSARSELRSAVQELKTEIINFGGDDAVIVRSAYSEKDYYIEISVSYKDNPSGFTVHRTYDTGRNIRKGEISVEAVKLREAVISEIRANPRDFPGKIKETFKGAPEYRFSLKQIDAELRPAADELWSTLWQLNPSFEIVKTPYGVRLEVSVKNPDVSAAEEEVLFRVDFNRDLPSDELFSQNLKMEIDLQTAAGKEKIFDVSVLGLDALLAAVRDGFTQTSANEIVLGDLITKWKNSLPSEGAARSEVRAGKFEKDDRVVHPVFGAGKILNISSTRIEILFDESPREGQTFFLKEVKKSLKHEKNVKPFNLMTADENELFERIEMVLGDSQGYPLSEVKDPFDRLLTILIAQKLEGKNYSPLLKRLAELLVRVTLDSPSDSFAGRQISGRNTTSGTLSLHFFESLFAEEGRSEVLKILAKRKVKSAKSQIARLNLDLDSAVAPFSSLKALKEIQATAPEYEFSISVLPEGIVILGRDGINQSEARFPELVINHMHTHGDQWPLEPSPEDTQGAATNVNSGDYILTFKPGSDEAELAVFDKKTKIWRHVLDQNRITNELRNAGFLEMPAKRSEIRANIPDISANGLKFLPKRLLKYYRETSIKQLETAVEVLENSVSAAQKSLQARLNFEVAGQKLVDAVSNKLKNVKMMMPDAYSYSAVVMNQAPAATPQEQQLFTRADKAITSGKEFFRSEMRMTRTEMEIIGSMVVAELTELVRSGKVGDLEEIFSRESLKERFIDEGIPPEEADELSKMLEEKIKPLISRQSQQEAPKKSSRRDFLIAGGLVLGSAALFAYFYFTGPDRVETKTVDGIEIELSIAPHPVFEFSDVDFMKLAEAAALKIFREEPGFKEFFQQADGKIKLHFKLSNFSKPWMDVLFGSEKWKLMINLNGTYETEYVVPKSDVKDRESFESEIQGILEKSISRVLIRELQAIRDTGKPSIAPEYEKYRGLAYFLRYSLYAIIVIGLIVKDFFIKWRFRWAFSKTIEGLQNSISFMRTSVVLFLGIGLLAMYRLAVSYVHKQEWNLGPFTQLVKAHLNDALYVPAVTGMFYLVLLAMFATLKYFSTLDKSLEEKTSSFFRIILVLGALRYMTDGILQEIEQMYGVIYGYGDIGDIITYIVTGILSIAFAIVAPFTDLSQKPRDEAQTKEKQKPRSEMRTEDGTGGLLTQMGEAENAWFETLLPAVDGEEKVLLQNIQARLKELLNQIRALSEKEEDGIRPFTLFKTRQYSEEPASPALQTPESGRRLRVGVLPVSGNPMTWAHVLLGLESIVKLKLDTVIYVSAGEVTHKAVLEKDSVSPGARMKMIESGAESFYPLLRYSDVGLRTSKVGEEYWHGLRELNPEQPADFYYLSAGENRPRAEKIGRNLALAAQERGLNADNKTHTLTWAVFPRSELGHGSFAQGNLDGILKENEIPLSAVVVEVPEFFDEISSTEYRRTHSAVYVPEKVDTFVRANGLYGVRSEVRTAPASKDVKDEIVDAGKDLADIWGNGEITNFFDAAIAKLAGSDEDKFDAANSTLNEVLTLIEKRIAAVSARITELVDDAREDESRPLDDQLDGLEKMQKRIAVIQDQLIDLSEAALRQGRESVADFEAAERVTQSDFSVLPPSATGSTFFPEDDLEQPETDPENEALDRVFRKAVVQYLKRILPVRYHTDLPGGIKRIGIGMRATVYFADANKKVYKLVPRFGLRNRQTSSSLKIDDDWLAGLAALERYLGDFSLSMKHVSSPVLPVRRNSRSQIENDDYLLFEQPFGLVVHKDYQRLRKIKNEAQFAVDPGNYTRLRRVARALFELQGRLLAEKSIIVFDMNPKNIVDEGGAAALSDFDLARLVQYDSALQKLEFYDFFKKLGPENYEPAYEEFFIMEFIEKMLYSLVQDAADPAKKYISNTIADEIGRMAAEGQPLARLFYRMIDTEEKRAELAEIFTRTERARADQLKEFSLRHLNENIFQYITEGLGRMLPVLNVENFRAEIFSVRSEVRTNEGEEGVPFNAESLQEELSRLANAVDLNLLPASSRLTTGDKLQIQGIRERLEFIKISVRDEEFLPPFEDAARILRDIQTKLPADAAFDKARGILTALVGKLSARSEMREVPGINSYTKESGEMDLMMAELLEKMGTQEVSGADFKNAIGALQSEEKKFVNRFARALTSNGRAPQTILERFVDQFLRGPQGLDAVQDFTVLTVPMTAANSISQEVGTWLKERIYAIVHEVLAEPTSKVGFMAYDSTAGSSQVYLGTSIGVTGMDAAQLKRVLERFEKEVKPELFKMAVKKLQDDLDGGLIGTAEFNNDRNKFSKMIDSSKIFAAQTQEVVLPEDAKVQIKSALDREDLAHAATLIEHGVLVKVKATMAQAEMVQEFQKFLESVPLKQRPPPDSAVIEAFPATVFNEKRIKAQAEYVAEMTDGQFDFHFEEKFKDAQRHFIPLGNFHTRHIPRLDHEAKNVRVLHEDLLEMLSMAARGEPVSTAEILILYQEYRLWLGRLLLISTLDTRYNLAFTKEGAQTIIDADNDGSLGVLLTRLEYLYSQTTQSMRDNSFLKWKSILYGLLLPVIFFLWLFKVRYDFFNPDLNPARRTLRDFRKMKGFYLIKFGGDEISLASRGPDGNIVIRAVGDFDKFKRYNEEADRTVFDDNFYIFLDAIHRAAEKAGVAGGALSEKKYVRFLQQAHEEILDSTMVDEDEKPIGKVRDFLFQSEQKIQTRGGVVERLRLWETPDGRVLALRGSKPSPDVEIYALDGSYLGLLKDLSIESLRPHKVTAGLTANTSEGIGDNPSNVEEASNKMADYARFQKKKGTQPGSSPDSVRVMTVGQIEEFKKQIGGEEKPEGQRAEVRMDNEDAEDGEVEYAPEYELVIREQKRTEDLAELILRKIAAEGRRIFEKAETRPMDRLGINVLRSEVRAAVTLPRAEEFAREFAKVYAILDTVPPAMAGMRGIDRIDDALLGLKAGSFSMFPAANRGALQNWADGLKANFTDIMPGLKIGTLIQSDLIFDGQNRAIIINGKSGGGKSSLSYAFTQMLPGRVKFGSEDKVLILQLPGHLLAASAFSYGQIRARAFNPPGAPRSHTMPVDELISAAPLTAWVHIESGKPEAILTGQGLPFWLSAYVPPSEPLAEPLISLKVEHMIGTNPPAGTSQNFGELARKLEPILFPPGAGTAAQTDPGKDDGPGAARSEVRASKLPPGFFYQFILSLSLFIMSLFAPAPSGQGIRETVKPELKQSSGTPQNTAPGQKMPAYFPENNLRRKPPYSPPVAKKDPPDKLPSSTVLEILSIEPIEIGRIGSEPGRTMRYDFDENAEEVPLSVQQKFAVRIEESFYGSGELSSDIASELGALLSGKENPVKIALEIFDRVPALLTYDQTEEFIDQMTEASGLWELSSSRYELVLALYKSSARSEVRSEELDPAYWGRRLVEYNQEVLLGKLRAAVETLEDAVTNRGKNLAGRRSFDQNSEKLIKSIRAMLERAKKGLEESYAYLAVIAKSDPDFGQEEQILFARAEQILETAQSFRSEVRQFSGLKERVSKFYDKIIMQNDLAWLAGESERNEAADLVMSALTAGPEEENARELALLALRQIKMPSAKEGPNPAAGLFLDTFWARAAGLDTLTRRRINLLVAAEFLEESGTFDMDREVHQATRIALNNYYTKITRALHELLLEARKKAGQRIKELQAKKEPGNYDQNIIAGYRWLQTQYNGAPWEALSKLNWLPMEMQNGDEKKLMDIYFRLIPKLPQVIEGNMALTDLLHINRSSFYRLRKDWYRTLRESVKTTVRKAVAQAAAEGQKTKVVIQLGVAGAAGGQEPITIAIETDKAMKELESEGISSQDADFVLHVFDRPSPFYERLGKNTIVYTEDLMPKEAGNEGLYFEKRQVTSDKEIKASEGLIGGFRRSAYLNSKMRFHKLDLLKEETFQIPEELQEGGLDYFMIHEVLQYVLPGQMERPENFEQTMGSMKQFLETLIRPQGIMSIEGRPSDQDTRAEKAVREVLANGRQPLSRSEARTVFSELSLETFMKVITTEPLTGRTRARIDRALSSNQTAADALNKWLEEEIFEVLDGDEFEPAIRQILTNKKWGNLVEEWVLSGEIDEIAADPESKFGEWLDMSSDKLMAMMVLEFLRNRHLLGHLLPAEIGAVPENVEEELNTTPVIRAALDQIVEEFKDRLEAVYISSLSSVTAGLALPFSDVDGLGLIAKKGTLKKKDIAGMKRRIKAILKEVSVEIKESGISVSFPQDLAKIESRFTSEEEVLSFVDAGGEDVHHLYNFELLWYGQQIYGENLRESYSLSNVLLKQMIDQIAANMEIAEEGKRGERIQLFNIYEVLSADSRKILAELSRTAEMNDAQLLKRAQRLRSEVRVGEWDGDEIKRITDFTDKKGPKIILVGGNSTAGKTTLRRYLRDDLSLADDYHMADGKIIQNILEGIDSEVYPDDSPYGLLKEYLAAKKGGVNLAQFQLPSFLLAMKDRLFTGKKQLLFIEYVGADAWLSDPSGWKPLASEDSADFLNIPVLKVTVEKGADEKRTLSFEESTLGGEKTRARSETRASSETAQAISAVLGTGLDRNSFTVQQLAAAMKIGKTTAENRVALAVQEGYFVRRGTRGNYTYSFTSTAENEFYNPPALMDVRRSWPARIREGNLLHELHRPFGARIEDVRFMADEKQTRDAVAFLLRIPRPEAAAKIRRIREIIRGSIKGGIFTKPAENSPWLWVLPAGITGSERLFVVNLETERVLNADLEIPLNDSGTRYEISGNFLFNLHNYTVSVFYFDENRIALVPFPEGERASTFFANASQVRVRPSDNPRLARPEDYPVAADFQALLDRVPPADAGRSEVRVISEKEPVNADYLTAQPNLRVLPQGQKFVKNTAPDRTAARSELRSSESKDEGKDITAKVREESPVIDWTWPGRLKVFQSRAVALLTEKRTAAGKTKADPVTVIDIGIGGKTREDADAAGVTVFDLVRELKLAGYTNIIVYGVDNHAPNVVSAAAALQTQDDIKNDPQIKLEFREGNIFDFEKTGLRGDIILSANTLFYYPPGEVLAVRERLSKLIEPYGFLGFAAVREADHVIYSIYGSNNQLEVSYTQYPGQPGGVPVESLTEDAFQQVVQNRQVNRSELRYAAAVVLRAVTDEKINEEERGTAAKILAEAGADAAVRELEDLKLKMMNQFPAAVSGTIDGLIKALSSLPSGGVDIAYSVEGRSSLEMRDFVNAVKRLGQIKRVLISTDEKVPEELTSSLREAGVMVSRVNFKRPGIELSGNQTYAGFVTAGEVESAPSFVPIISLETESLAGSDAARLVIALQTAVALLVANEISEERKGYKLKPAELLTKYKLFEGFENAVISGDGQNIRISGAGVMAYLQYQAAQALARSA